MSFKSWKMSLGTGIALLALLAPAFGALLSQNIAPFLPGVDSKGNQSAALGANGVGKFYKETVTGILVAVGTAVVANQSGGAATFTNKGLSIKDLFTGTWKKDTSDQEIVGPPNFGFSGATLVVIYNPAALP